MTRVVHSRSLTRCGTLPSSDDDQVRWTMLAAAHGVLRSVEESA